MTDDLQELDGVGPAREEKLNDEGYETYDDLAEADAEALADSINRLSEDTALELVVQSQNMLDLEEAEVEEEVEAEDDSEESEGVDVEEEPAEVEEEEDSQAPSGAEDESQSASETHFEVEVSFTSPEEYDTFYHTLIEERCRLNRTNRTGVDNYEKLLDALRNSSPEADVSVELTADELNDLHNAVLEQRMDYQGDNIIDYMDALRVVEEEVNAAREEFLF